MSAQALPRLKERVLKCASTTGRWSKSRSG
jgi:hypothetical protein